VPDAVTRFLRNLRPLLARLDDQLGATGSLREAAWTLCEFTGRELNLADCAVYLPNGLDALQPTATWGLRRNGQHSSEARPGLSIATNLVGNCARQLRTQRSEDLRHGHLPSANGEADASELAVPVHHEDILLAILDSKDPHPGFYDERYQQVFEAIAECGAAHLWRLRDRSMPRD
jgi:hypothetical protein